MKRLNILIHLTKVQPLREARAEFSQLIALLYFLHSDPQEIDNSYHRNKTAEAPLPYTEFSNAAREAETSPVKVLPCFLSFFLADNFRIPGEQLRGTRPSEVFLRSSEFRLGQEGLLPLACPVIHFTRPI